MSSPPPIRVLLIGTGFGALVHAPGFTRHPAFRLVGVASGTLANARRVATEFDVPHATDDWSGMLAEIAADLVSIATPVGQHYTMARAALERGRHGLRHTPLAMNAAEAPQSRAPPRAPAGVNVVN